MESTEQPAIDQALLAALAVRLDALAVRIARQIRAEVPGYAALPYDEHRRDVHTQISAVLAGLQARRPPPDAAIEHARAVGRRRAGADLALPDVIEAYHIAYREIWNELLGLARADDPAQARALVTVVGLLWNWFHRLSAAVAEAHVEQSRLRATTRAALHRRLVEALRGGAAPGPGAVARDLGFDPDGPFVVACADGVAETVMDALAGLLAAVAAPDGVAHCSVDGDRAVLVAQGCPDHGLAAAVHAVAPQARVGIGLARAGLSGAALSLQDADDALSRARELAREQVGPAGPAGADAGGDPSRLGPVVRFADDWLLAALGRTGPRLDQVLTRGAAVAAANPGLADTVRAFAAGRFSVTACARLLQIHPNSAKYRLDRWHALTGWDPRTFAGLSSSMVCLDRTGNTRDPGAD